MHMLNVTHFQAALQNFGDAGGNFDLQAPVFDSPLAPGGYVDATKFDNTLFEDDPVLTLGLADPEPNSTKWRALFEDIRQESTRLGIEGVAALLVKQSADGLVNTLDYKGVFPAGSPDAWGAMFELFGKPDKKTGRKKMSRQEFKKLVQKGKLPVWLRKKYRAATRCPTFPAGFWKFGTDSPNVVKAREIWPTDPASCEMKSFPTFQCP